MSAKLYESCPACEGTGEAPQFQWSGAPTCPGCRGLKLIETGLTTGQFTLYHRKAHEEYERGLIDGFKRGAAWGEAGRADFSLGDLDSLRMELGECLEMLRAECRQRREAAGLGEPTEVAQAPPGPPDPPRSACAWCGHAYADHYRGSGDCCVLDCPCGYYRNPEVA